MSSKIQNLIVRIATRVIVVNQPLYNAVDDFYLQRTQEMPFWAKKELEKMISENK